MDDESVLDITGACLYGVLLIIDLLSLVLLCAHSRKHSLKLVFHLYIGTFCIGMYTYNHSVSFDTLFTLTSSASRLVCGYYIFYRWTFRSASKSSCVIIFLYFILVGIVLLVREKKRIIKLNTFIDHNPSQSLGWRAMTKPMGNRSNIKKHTCSSTF
jgi:hypothetical protein